jgi:hypothetical protein
MKWKTIRLELAATAEFPNGSVGRGFLIRAPVNDDGKIDEQRLRDNPDRAKVSRIWSNEADERGRLVRVDGHWVMRFPGHADRTIDDQPRFRAGNEILVRSEGADSTFTVRLFD